MPAERADVEYDAADRALDLACAVGDESLRAQRTDRSAVNEIVRQRPRALHLARREVRARRRDRAAMSIHEGTRRRQAECMLAELGGDADRATCPGDGRSVVERSGDLRIRFA